MKSSCVMMSGTCAAFLMVAPVWWGVESVVREK